MIFWLALGIFVAGFGVGSGVTYKITSDSFDAEKFQEQKIVEARIAKKDIKIDEIADALEKARNEKTVEYKRVTTYIKEYVDRPVYRTECIDDDGLRAVNSIITDTTFDPSKPKATVRKRNATGTQNRKGSSGEAGRAIPPAK